MEKKTSELFPKDAVFGEISGDKINSHAFLVEWIKKEEASDKKTCKITVKLAMLLFLLVIAVIIKGCGDYYINVDKDAVKIEADVEGLLDGND